MTDTNNQTEAVEGGSSSHDLLALTADEQREIAGMSHLERELFADYLLDHNTSGPNYYDGWTRVEFAEALFSGPQAWRDAFKAATKRRSEANA